MAGSNGNLSCGIEPWQSDRGDRGRERAKLGEEWFDTLQVSPVSCASMSYADWDHDPLWGVSAVRRFALS